MGVEKKVYSFRLEENLVQTLKEKAAKQNRTLSNYVETILMDEVKANGEQENEIISQVPSANI